MSHEQTFWEFLGVAILWVTADREDKQYVLFVAAMICFYKSCH